MKSTAVILLPLAFAVTNCASVPKDSEYNQGVHAYQAKNYAEARVHWEKAADSGEILARNNLGYLLYTGLGGREDPVRALGLWRKAAAEGNSEAQWHLGTVYEEGRAVALSNVEAYAWYRCAIATAAVNEGEVETERQIADDARRSLADLLSKLTKDEFGDAKALADDYIAKYSHVVKGSPPPSSGQSQPDIESAASVER